MVLRLWLPLMLIATPLPAAGLPPGVAGKLPEFMLAPRVGAPQGKNRNRSHALLNPRLDCRLNRILAANSAVRAASRAVSSPPRRLVVQIVTGSSRGRASLEKAVAQAGGRVTGWRRSGRVAQALVPVTSLSRLSRLAGVVRIREPAAAVPLSEMVSEGVHDCGADLWHQAGRDGRGVKVGVIDVGFSGYRALLGSELPDRVEARNFIDGEADDAVDAGSAHGTACAEIIHDLAPAAALCLARVSSEIDLQEAADWLAQSCGVDIISTALGWYNLAPGDGTGVLADIVAAARAAGIFWVTAAGNDRLRHWDGSFVDYDGDGILDFSRERNIDYFGDEAGNAYLLEPGYSYTIYLRWSDWTEVSQDYDIYVYRWNGDSWGEPVASSVELQDGGEGQTPAETVAFVTSGEPTAYGFIIYKARPDVRPVDFELFVPFAPTLVESTTGRSLPNLADVPAAMTVAAVNAGDYRLEEYSSEGPTNGPGGALSGGLDKPDIAAFTNVSTATFGWYGFTGTSAATAHVAGAAALWLSENPQLGPTELANALLQQVFELNGPGFDFRTGWGGLHLETPEEPPGPEVVNWRGTVDTVWERAANWSGGKVPSAGDLVVVPTAVSGRQPYLTIAAQISTLELDGAVTIGVAGRLSLSP